MSIIFRGTPGYMGKVVTTPAHVDDVPLTVQTLQGQTADTLDILASDGETVLAKFDFGGNLTSPTLNGQVVGGVQDTVEAIAAAGAIANKTGSVAITGTAAVAATLASPTATVDDGKRLTIYCTTTFAHTVTTPTNGINGNKHIATFAAAGDHIALEAYQGVWYTIDNNTTLS